MAAEHPRRRRAARRPPAATPATHSPSPPPSLLEADPRARPIATALLIFAALLAIYVLNFRMLSSGDSLPTRVLPFSILREGNLALDEFSWEPTSRGKPPYYLRAVGHHLYSGSPIVLPVVIAPLYALPAWWLAANGISYDDVRARVVIVAMERISAAVVVALSAALLFLLLQRLTTWRAALALTAVYALGTSTWSIASQALWTHGLAELLLVLLTMVFLRRDEPTTFAAAAAGVIAVLAIGNRPPMIIFALLSLIYVWRHQRRRLLAFAAVPVVGGTLLLAFNLLLYGRAAGGYGVSLRSFDGNVVTGVAGLLVSPNRGLFVYTPLMLFAVAGAVRIWRTPAHAWLRYLVVGVGLHLLIYGTFKEWWGGYAYGPRYMTDVLPALMLFLIYGVTPLWHDARARVLIAALALFGIAVQAIGVYAADDSWNREPTPLEQAPRRVWDLADSQIVRGWRNGWHAGDLAPIMFDAFRRPLPALVAPLREADLTSKLTAHDFPAAVEAGAVVSGTVEITNRSTVGWPAFSGDGIISARYLVFLLARWMHHGTPLPGAGDVLPLPSNLAPGETASIHVSLPAPAVTGDLKLELRMTQAIDRQSGLVGHDALKVPISVR